MFREIAALLPEKAKAGIVTLTIARKDDEHLLVTVQPYPLEGENAPKLTPCAFIGTPEELDCEYPIDFTPAANVADHGSINEQIKRSAQENADKPKPAKASSAPAKAATTTKAPSKPAASAAKPAAKAPVKSAATIALERSQKAANDKKEADDAAAEKARKEQEERAKAAQKKKDDKAAEIAKLQAELEALDKGSTPELPIAGGS